jgi:phosphopantothenoylcysteine decarboxylase/phosphopantothenate--cysteine ligase
MAKSVTKTRNPKGRSLEAKTVLHVLTGSIAAYKAGDLIQEMRGEGARVVCVLTECAKQFVTPLTIRALSGERVYDNFFSPDSPYDVIHTSLADQADLVLVCPASANFIARLAGGMANDLASSIILVTRRPVVIVPAMNDQMYTHPLTQRNINQLREIGYHFIDPIVGHLVCGKEAIGHVSEPATIVQTLQTLIKK